MSRDDTEDGRIFVRLFSVTGDFEPTDINSPMFGATHYGEKSEEGIVDRIHDTLGKGKLGETVAKTR